MEHAAFAVASGQRRDEALQDIDPGARLGRELGREVEDSAGMAGEPSLNLGGAKHRQALGRKQDNPPLPDVFHGTATIADDGSHSLAVLSFPGNAHSLDYGDSMARPDPPVNPMSESLHYPSPCRGSFSLISLFVQFMYTSIR